MNAIFIFRTTFFCYPGKMPYSNPHPQTGVIWDSPARRATKTPGSPTCAIVVEVTGPRQNATLPPYNVQARPSPSEVATSILYSAPLKT